MVTLLKKEGNRYIWLGGYDTREVPKLAGFRWDSVARHWYTDSSAIAQKLNKFAPKGMYFPEIGSPQPEHFLSKSGDSYVWSGDFATRDLPKQAGFRWDSAKRQWWTKMQDSAAKLSKYASPELRVVLESVSSKKAESIEQSRAASADVSLPVPVGLDYLPFQKAGIRYALNRPNTLFGDEMGLGKTIQAIGVINASPEIRSVLVVSPATLKLNWQRELRKWLVRPLTVGVAGKSVPDTDIVIVNYDVLGKFKSILNRDWDLVIADECHYIKNPKAQRTKHLVGSEEKKDGKYVHIAGIADRAKRKIFLTGTPILNRPVELWPIVSSLTPETFPFGFMGFAKRYAAAQETRYGWDFSGASHLDELQEKLRGSVMVRRLKKDVLTELPPKRRQVVEIEPTPEIRHLIASETAMLDEHQERLEQHRVAVEIAKASESEDDYNIAVARLREVSQVAFDEISKERHELAVAKVPSVIEFLNNALEQEDKVVVFAHHRDVIDAIRNAFPDEAVSLTGEDSTDARQKAVDEFQKNPKVKLFIGSIKAAGVGITLTAASHVVFAELDWVPGNVTQAEDRCHRIGQRDNVLIQQLVFDGSLDSKLAKTIVEKQDVIDKALDDTHAAPAMPDLGSELESAISALEAVGVKEHSATAGVGFKALAESPPLTLSEVAQVHAQLRYIAGVDDGAYLRDGVGFNKIDTGIGRELAMLPSLSQKQAHLGKKILAKYHRQIGSWEQRGADLLDYSGVESADPSVRPKRNFTANKRKLRVYRQSPPLSVILGGVR